MDVVDGDPPGLHTARLRDHLLRHRPDLARGPLRGGLCAGGRSNLTYVVTDGASEFVLRRPPLGHVLATAHDMVREYTVISALAPTDVPVPAALLLCTDESVLGAPFYLMEKVDGAVLRTRHQAEGLPEADRHEIAYAMIDTLAALHAVDPYAVGLGEFGHPDGFLARQVRRWSGQLDRSRSRELPAAETLRDALAASVPSSPKPAIVHGDYRLDNLLVDPAARRVNAVIDWEMATLGDPLTDLGLLITYWEVLGERDANPIADAIGPTAGFPSGRALLDRYAGRSPVDLSALEWYIALACYKLAVILEGIHFRYKQGKTVGAGFDRIGEMVPPLLDTGIDALTPRRK
jgi:aminoglycoside phosphotransferase (APT) family kinase protein